MDEDNEIHMSTAEEGIGTAILDILAEVHLFAGVFYISTDDDGGFSIQLLDLPPMQWCKDGIEEVSDE
jgi:hypothetical protein